MTIDQLVFAGLNSRVAALDRYSGDVIWQWKCPKPKLSIGFVTLLVDGDRLIVSVNGYTYCLDPLTGEPIWYNPLNGFRTGVTSLTSIWGASQNSILAQAQAASQAGEVADWGGGAAAAG